MTDTTEVKCNLDGCENKFDGNKPPFAIIAFPMKVFCSEECLKGEIEGRLKAGGVKS